MFGLRPKLPVTEAESLWVDQGFLRLGGCLGWDRLKDARVVLPTDEYFPDPYSATEAGLEVLFQRVCAYMAVPRSSVELAVIPDNKDVVELLPSYSYRPEGPAGLHFGSQADGELPLVAVTKSLLKDPLTLVATLSHELGHVILLGGGHVSRADEDMEPLTDLVTVFLGLGIFNANASRLFRQFHEDRKQGWSMRRLGYLPEVVFAYALARFAAERGEARPAWTVHLSTNLRTWFRQSAAWLEKDGRALS